jgi:hypothetical protein
VFVEVGLPCERVHASDDTVRNGVLDCGMIQYGRTHCGYAVNKGLKEGVKESTQQHGEVLDSFSDYFRLQFRSSGVS